MATYTRADLRNRVLGRLGVLDPNEAPQAEDSVDVLEHIQQTLEELHDDGLIPFDLDGDSVPAPYMIPLSYLVALPLIPDYGVSGERAMAITLGAGRGMKRLYRLKSQPYLGTPQQATYY